MTRDALAFEGIEYPTSTRKVSPDKARSIGQLELIAPTVPANRNTDPRTSVEGVHDAMPRIGRQQQLLLLAFSDVGSRGLTASEAGERSGLSANRSCCYWRRVTDLLKAGLIAPTGEERVSLDSGSLQEVRAVTPTGLAVAEVLRFRARSLDKGNTIR